MSGYDGRDDGGGAVRPGAEYLVVMTTHIPEGTPAGAVEDIRTREAAHSRELAAQGHLRRLWALPGEGRTLGLWRARDATEMEAVLKSLPLDPWMTVQTTTLAQHPSDPAITQPG